MFLLHKAREKKRIVLLFGEGLVGSSIATALPDFYAREQHAFTYDDSRQQPVEFAAIGDRIGQLCRTAPGDVDVVWAAGKAGFTASESDVDNELAIYKRVLAFTCIRAEQFPEIKVSFHCISSAGGLFEDQKRVTITSKPLPMRPYGRLKLLQETALLAASDRIRKRIYRLSTAYGHIERGHRFGLISTLIYNGVRHQVSQIYGDMNTLRDYVWSGDVGEYIAREIARDVDSDRAIAHLVSGKPSSIYEIKRIVEDILKKHIYIAFRNQGENKSDITFSEHLLPDDWHPVAIQTAARSIYQTWEIGGGVF